MNRLSQAIEVAKVPIVPATYVQMGGGADADGESGGGANAFSLLMTLLATDKLQTTGVAASNPEQAESVRAIKAAIHEQMGVERTVATAPSNSAPNPAPNASAKPAKQQPAPVDAGSAAQKPGE